MSNRSISTSKGRSEAFQQALALLNNPQHAANRLAIAERYRDMMATTAALSGDLKAHSLLLVCDQQISDLKVQAANLNRQRQ